MRYLLTDDLWTALEPLVRQAMTGGLGRETTAMLEASDFSGTGSVSTSSPATAKSSLRS